MERWRREQVFHDRQAWERATDQRRRGRSLAFDDDTYLDHETWVRPALARLGNVSGRPVLDFGCGHGMAAVVLARRGARVTAFDLSHGYLDEARNRARQNHVAIDFVRADGERLPFADQAFEAIWGSAILHHLDLATAGPELRRVLRPGGVAVFCEPWGENALLNWARRSLPYPEKGRTPDEQPLDQMHVRQLRAIFAGVEIQGCQLLGMARRVLKNSRLLSGLDWCDRQLLARVPRLERYCRYVVVTLRR
ncbi:MAG: class I SAM-dependent methyltransferase [Planctomycetes bacterium]|nr:class I SAM-dependent methyltransferase [Planctomycetota bacterium]